MIEMNILSKAVDIFIIGFSGVFISLIILQLSISLFSRIIFIFEKNDTSGEDAK